jgi:hypothetical protein
MDESLSNKKLPIAALVLIIVVAIGVSLWRGLTVLQPPSAGKDIAVHPGMYNLREEMQKPRRLRAPGGSESASTSNGATL